MILFYIIIINIVVVVVMVLNFDEVFVVGCCCEGEDLLWGRNGVMVVMK